MKISKKIKKMNTFTNQTGWRRWITPAIVVIIVGGIGTYLLMPSHAASSLMTDTPTIGVNPAFASQPKLPSPLSWSGSFDTTTLTGTTIDTALTAGYSGTLPPYNPTSVLQPNGTTSNTCARDGNNSVTCINAEVADINYARRTLENNLAPISINAGAFITFTPAQQLFYISNLERVSRGLPPAVELTNQLNSVAQAGANANTDPSLSGWLLNGGTNVTNWGGTWLSGNNALLADFIFMYDDGTGGANVYCSPTNHTSCWGHRDVILGTFPTWSCGGTSALYSGVGYTNNLNGGSGDITQIFVGGCGNLPNDPNLTWAQAQQRLPSTVTITGRVYNSTTGYGIPNAVIHTCQNNPTLTTNNYGYWSMTLTSGTPFCVRLYSGAPDSTTWAGPYLTSKPNTSSSYELQTASGGSMTGYDFKFTSPFAKRLWTNGGSQGYVMDDFGKLWPLGGAPAETSLSPYWLGMNKAQAFVVNPAMTEAYVLDLYGGVHAVGLGGNAAPPAINDGYYDASHGSVARDIVITDWSIPAGYVLDGYGGVHPFGGATSTVPATGLWASNLVARRIACASSTTVTAPCIMMDDFGGAHAFNGLSRVSGGAYYTANNDSARGLVLNPNGLEGYEMDGRGEIYPYAINGAALPPGLVNSPLWPTENVANDLFISNWANHSGYLLDYRGGIHRLNTTVVMTGGPYW